MFFYVPVLGANWNSIHLGLPDNLIQFLAKEHVWGILTKTTGTQGCEKNTSVFTMLTLDVSFPLENRNLLDNFTQAKVSLSKAKVSTFVR